MKKKLVQINIVCNGSTGKIMNQIQQEALKKGWEAYSFFGRGEPVNDKCYKIGNKIDTIFHVLITRLFDKHGHGSKRATKKMIQKIKEIDPDIIHMHNIHGYYIHLETLFNYLKTCNKKIVWTLHDCWAFTGHCSHFTYPKCDKWKTGCNKCTRKKDYPKSSILDNSKSEYLFKKELFNGIKDLTLVTPSKWLADLVKQSFLKDYDIKVINNGIDLNVFKPTYTIDVRSKYNIPKNKEIILGVSSIWNESKGLYEFYELAKNINEQYVCVLVGLTDKQLERLPSNIIGIKKTENVEELANLYTQALVVFNPSREETFSLVTIEAIACGTPVIAYNNTAIKELIANIPMCLSLDIEERIDDNILKTKEYLGQVDKQRIDFANNYKTQIMISEYMQLYLK